MKSKQFSTAVTAFCIIALLLFVAVKCCAQIETVRGPITNPPHGIKWNQSAYFATATKPKPLDWSTYGKTIDGKQISIWLWYAAAGTGFGAREAYHADQTIFEKKWGVSPTSFWGSQAWKRNYIGSNPDNPHKSEIFGNVGRDFWHTFGLASKGAMFTATFAITQRKHPVKYRVANAFLGYALQSIFSSLTYNALR
jgi:hypothetical protein